MIPHIDTYALPREAGREGDDRVRVDQNRHARVEAVNQAINQGMNALNPEDRLARIALELLDLNPRRRPTAADALRVLRNDRGLEE